MTRLGNTSGAVRGMQASKIEPQRKATKRVILLPKISKKNPAVKVLRTAPGRPTKVRVPDILPILLSYT